MDTELLKTFVEVTRTRHFGRAADNLFLTPAAVSARIRQLEQTLGVRLLHRTRGNVQVTAEGERLLPYANQVLLTWAQARQDVVLKAEHSRRLSLGATPGYWRFGLPDVASRLGSALPELALRVEAWPQTQLLELLLSRQLDIALVYDEPGHGELTSEKVGQFTLALLSTAADQSLKGALEKSYIYVDWGAAFRLFHARRFGETPALLYTNQADLALDYMKRHGASAYLPPSCSKGQGVSLHPVVDAPSFQRPVYAVYRNNSAASEQIRAALAQLGG